MNFIKLLQEYNIDTSKLLCLKTEKEQIEAVKQYGFVIQHISNPSLKIQLEAVKEDGQAIAYISNPSPEVQIEAVNNLLQQDIADINGYYMHKLGKEALEYLLKNLVIKDIVS